MLLKNTDSMEVNSTDHVAAKKALRIRLVLTDCDGVLTDAGVYYSAKGEEMKRFSMRDGMGVERLRKLAGVDTGIMTGENSGIVAARAVKLEIRHLYLGIKDKHRELQAILLANNLQPDEVAFIGDDLNDQTVIQAVGLSACPSDAMETIKGLADYVCRQPGGHGAFREFAEFIIHAKMQQAPAEAAIPNGQDQGIIK